MIGFYNYSVIVTYLGVISSMIGISLACNGIFDGAILCLALAGACDTFDGKIARAMKNRTHEMEIFGVQIDSLCDMVCFGVTPAVICYQMGLKSVAGICCEIFFVLCGVIRLAYFNMLEELKHSKPASADEKKYYHLPGSLYVPHSSGRTLYDPAGSYAVICRLFLHPGFPPEKTGQCGSRCHHGFCCPCYA